MMIAPPQSAVRRYRAIQSNSDLISRTYVFQHPASQRDGGEPLFAFEVRRDRQEATLRPRGRFGADSFTATTAEENRELMFDYYFVDSGPGLISLAIRPKEYPWVAEITASYEGGAHTTGPVTLTAR